MAAPDAKPAPSADPPRRVRRRLSGWGRYPTAECLLARPERLRDAVPGDDPCIPRGRGRAYGDAALNAGHTVLLTERLNRFLAFDDRRGLLTVEAGASVGEVLAVTVPRGWFLPVTPGTRHASVGGCVAADVHGKNHHHTGAFSSSVQEVALVTADGRTVRCGPEAEPDLFWATVGGMGLTGILTEVTLRLMPVGSAHLRVTHHPAPNLDAVLDLLEGDPGAAPYSVAWIDCLARGSAHGRGIVMAGRHAEPDEVPGSDPFRVPRRAVYRMPVDLPSGVLGRRTVGLFNALYHRRNVRSEPFTVDYLRYFYPLDGLDDWNRLYGRPGFIQYQFVVPEEGGRKALKRALVTLDAAGVPAFLAVLKKLGPEGSGLLSFPMPGYTLALDLPLAAPETLACAARLDALVAELGGRVYLAKDACLGPGSLAAMYPRLPAWRAVKDKVDPEGRFRSDLAARLGLEAAG